MTQDREPTPIHPIRFFFAFLLLAACIWLIWSNSMQSPEASAARSRYVAELLGRFLGGIFGAQSSLVVFAQTHVRKIAHAVEFALLGVTSVAMLAILGRVNIHMVVHAAFLVLLVAVADETIQVFTNRGASVLDVVLDFAGGLAGLSLALLVYGGIRAIFRRR